MRKIDTEYNKERIVNEDSTLNGEFGSTPHSESESFSDNTYSVRDEINDNPTSNNEKPEEEEKRRKDKKEDKEESTEKESNSSGSSSSSGAGGASGAIASAAVAAASAIIAVGSLAALVGIDLTGAGDNPPPSPTPGDYGSVVINNIIRWSNQIGIRLELDGLEGDSYIVSVENDQGYKKEKDIDGTLLYTFNNLTEKTSYDVQVKNVTKDNYVLFKQSVTTIGADEASIAFDAVPDLSDGTGSFEVLLAYNYNDQSFGDSFELTISNKAGTITKRRQLEKSSYMQTVYLNTQGEEELNFNDSEGFNYQFSFEYDGQTKFTSGDFIFDTSKTPKKYTVRLEPGDLCSGDPVETLVREGKGYTFPKAEDVFTTPAHYTFRYWEVKNSTSKYLPNRTTEIIKDLTLVPYFEEEYDPAVDYVTFTKEIDFTESTHDITVSMDYFEPGSSSSSSLSDFKITFYNPDPNNGERNVVYNLEKQKEDQTITLDDSEIRYDIGREIPYTITYNRYGAEVTYESDTVIFTDVNGIEVGLDSFEFTQVIEDRSTQLGPYKLGLKFNYQVSGTSLFYNNPWLKVYDYNDLSNPVAENDFEVTTDEQFLWCNGSDGLNMTTGLYVYEFGCKSGVDSNKRQDVVYSTGVINMADYNTHFDITFDSNYYEIGDKTYIGVELSLFNYDGFGELTLSLNDNRESEPVQYEYGLEARNGKQLIDITDGIPTAALEEQDGCVYMVLSSTASSYLAGPASVGPLTKYESSDSGFVAGYVANNSVEFGNMQFEIGVLRYDAADSEQTLYSPRLHFNDKTDYITGVDLDISEFGSGLTTYTVSIPLGSYAFNGLIANKIIYNRMLNLSFSYTRDGSWVEDPVELCSNTVFTVK